MGLYVVTGANRGIGLELCRQLAARGDEVVAAINESGAEQMMLAMEVRTAVFHPQEYAHLDDLKACVDYWRQWVKD